jgi:hypothetical protein
VGILGKKKALENLGLSSCKPMEVLHMMTLRLMLVGRVPLFLFAFLLAIGGGALARSEADERDLGPQSTVAKGQKHVLMVAVRFPDVNPSTPLEVIRRRVAEGLNLYVAEQSYGIASVKADFRGYLMLPSPIADYKISPYNYRVDKSRIRELIEDTMTLLERDVDFSAYDQILIIPAVRTTAGQGYGTVQVKSASGPDNLVNATYKLEVDKRNIFIDKSASGLFQRNNIAILPMWQDHETVGVLVTTPELVEAALKAGLAIQMLLGQSRSNSDVDNEALVRAAIAAFKGGDFEKSYAISKGTHPARQ